jgi:thiol-disulfide isomerase/thioredoxin
MSQRRAVAFGVGIPVLLIAALLAWGVARNGGQAGGLGVNDDFGIVPLSVEPDADFELVTMEGETLKLSDLKGKVVMVDFWSSWCAPCRAEGQLLADTYREWRDRGVEFVGIAIWDDRGPVESFIDANGIEYANGIDEKGRIAVDWGVRGIPEKFFVNAEGEVVKKVIGPNTAASLRDVLTDLTDEALGIRTMLAR